MVGLGAVIEFTEQHWQALAGHKPSLKPQVQLYCHQYRGQDWPVVEDSLNQKHYHISTVAYGVVKRLDGQTTVAQLAEQWPTQQAQTELVQLLVGLYQADLLAGNFPLLADSLVARANRKNWQRWLNPLAQRFPLINPNPWLKRGQGFTDRIFSPAGWWCWVALVVAALVVAAGHSHELGQHWQSRFGDPGNLLWLPLVYVLMKIIHEWAHGAMMRRFGGDCLEAGIMILVFVPLPYVNADTSNSMARHARMWIAAAGILAELGMAALALLIWTAAGPGLVKDLSFNVLLVGFAASLLFNANPLLKFDGYYLLADWLQIPNFAARANQYLAYLWQHYGLGLQAAHSPVELAGEKPWLMGYGLLAGAYRLAILAWIVSFLAQRWWWAGLAVGLWALLVQWLWPTARGLLNNWHKSYAEHCQWRFLGVVGLSSLLVYGGLFQLPLPHSNYAQGVVRLPDNAVFSAAPGFVAEVLAEDGQWIESGTPIIQLANTELNLQAKKIAAELAEHRQRHKASLVRQPAQAQAAAMEIELAAAKLSDLNLQLNSLTLVAPRAGRLSLPAAQNLSGRWVEEGAVLAHVFDGENLQAQVLVGQREQAQLEPNATQVRVKTELQPAQTHTATLTNITPQASDQLPSRILGSAGGGRLAVDGRDPDGLTSLQSWFSAELILPAAIMTPVVPNRLHVRFRYQNQPIGVQMWQQMRQWWLHHSSMG